MTKPPHPSPHLKPVMYRVRCLSCGEKRTFNSDNYHPWCMMCADDRFDWGREEMLPRTFAEGDVP